MEAFTYMEGTPEEVARKFEEQARVQQAQHEILQVQLLSINDLKKKITLLLKKKTESEDRSFFQQRQGQREDE